jgi:hypothetical protein
MSTKNAPEQIVPDTAAINDLIKGLNGNTNNVSDGYHTFGELYDHRVAIFITLAKVLATSPVHAAVVPVWRSLLHSDGTSFDGWFVLGIHVEPGRQITYHLPVSEWGSCWFADVFRIAPPFDGHTSADVLKRLATII